SLEIKHYHPRLERYEAQLKAIVSGIEGVKAVTSKIGATYTAPPIYPLREFDMPQKVLLVDDEAEFVETLSERLRSRRFDASVVYDGEEALNYVAKDEPDVMVLDLKMPGIDGIEVLRRIKQTNPLIEVIILTGHGSEREEQLAAELGAFAYLHKPVDVDALAQVMRAAYAKVETARHNTGGQDE
ncbi:MAG: response regulator, partial [Calditrichota bacterium]